MNNEQFFLCNSPMLIFWELFKFTVRACFRVLVFLGQNTVIEMKCLIPKPLLELFTLLLSRRSTLFYLYIPILSLNSRLKDECRQFTQQHFCGIFVISKKSYHSLLQDMQSCQRSSCQVYVCKIHIIALNSGKNDTNMCKNQYTSMQQGQTQYVMSTNNTCSNQVNVPFTRNCRTKLHFSLPLNMQYGKANVRKITLQA